MEAARGGTAARAANDGGRPWAAEADEAEGDEASDGAEDESAADAARRAAIARDLCGSGDEGGGGPAAAAAPGGAAANRLSAAAVRDWLQMVSISEPARERFAEHGTDGAELGQMSRRLAGPPKRCTKQLDELKDVYGLRTLGERCRFVAALEEFIA